MRSDKLLHDSYDDDQMFIYFIFQINDKKKLEETEKENTIEIEQRKDSRTQDR